MKWITRNIDDIVLATDFSECAEKAFAAAVRAARLFDARLHILHANEEESAIGARGSGDVIAFLRDVAVKRLQWLARLEAQAQAAGVVARAATRSGPASREIAAYAQEVDCGLVVLGLSGVADNHHLVGGSTAMAILRRFNRPVMLVRQDTDVATVDLPGSFSHILYPTDLTAASRAGLAAAEAVARAAEAKLTLFHVAQLPQMIPSLPGEPPIPIPIAVLPDPTADLNAELQTVLAAQPAGDAVDATTAVTIDMQVASAVSRYAKDKGVDLVLVPRHSSRGVMSYIFGRTAEQLVRTSPVPVLAFSPPTDG